MGSRLSPVYLAATDGSSSEKIVTHVVDTIKFRRNGTFLVHILSGNGNRWFLYEFFGDSLLRQFLEPSGTTFPWHAATLQHTRNCPNVQNGHLPTPTLLL